MSFITVYSTASRREKILRWGTFNHQLPAVGMDKLDFLGMQGEPADQWPFQLAGGAAVIALVMAEKNTGILSRSSGGL